MLTEDQIKAVLPVSMKKTINKKLIDEINSTLGQDTELLRVYRDNVLGYISVIKDGRFKIKDYLNAVKYVTFKLLGDTHINAYIKTFPERYQRHLKLGSTREKICSYASMYNGNKLVLLILKQSLIPTYILNADTYQETVNILANIVKDTNIHPRDRVSAGNSLLTHLKSPEVKKIELDVTNKQDSIMNQLRDSTEQLVIAQRNMIMSGNKSAKEIIEQDIIMEVIE